MYYIYHIDGTVTQHVTNNADARTHCAYLFFAFERDKREAVDLQGRSKLDNWRG